MFTSTLLASLLTVGAAEADASHLAVIRPAPDFALKDQDGKALRFSSLRGKVVLVSFVFTTCSGSCPATTARMSAAADELERQGLFKGDGVRLVSVTLDPKRDTPDALRKYMKLYDLDARRWSFLTGAPADVAKVIDAWGMWVRPAPMGQLDHPSRIFLVDKGGRLREVYSLEYFKPAWAVEDVRALLKEATPPSPKR
jgi:protein SCO1/2